jgi:1-phosphofructokinase family hexose kinase
MASMIYTVTLNPSLDRTVTVPRIVDDEMVRATSSRLDWGGKGFNVSRVLRALGTESVALGFAGGATGGMLEGGLRDLGISTDLVRLSAETRTNTVVIESETGRYIKVNEPGPAVRPDEQAALLERIRGYLRNREPTRGQGRDLWVLSGSLPPGLADDFYAELVGMVQASGARALLDASGQALRAGCTAAPFLVKPNVSEAVDFAGMADPAVWEAKLDLPSADGPRAIEPAMGTAMTLAHPFLDSGVAFVALSLGAGGLLLASPEGNVMATPPAVRARNPVGAGDALLAGVSWALERERPLEEVARWGVASGTASARGLGVAAVTRSEVEAIYQQVTVHEVA